MDINRFIARLTSAQKTWAIIILALVGALLWFSFISQVNPLNDVSLSGSTANEVVILDCTGGNLKSPLCEEREEALEKLKVLKELKTKLVDFNIESWSVTKFQLILGLEEEGDKLFKEEYFGKSKKIYMKAISASEDLIEEVSNALKSYILEGFRQLESNAWEEAEDSFRKALVIAPSNSDALKGLSRSLVLEQILQFLDEAKLLIKINALDQAKALVYKAFGLDKENLDVQGVKRKVDKLIKNRDLGFAISSGFNLLERKEFSEAIRAFNSALSIDKTSSAALSGLKAVKKEKKKEKIREERALAEEAFRSEDFKRSSLHFQNILDLEKNTSFAMVGLKNAIDYIAIEKKIDRYLEKPERLSSTAVFEEAKQLVSIIEYYDLGERLLGKQQFLITFIEKYSQPIQLTISSNNKTYISIKNGRDLGLFSSKDIRLFPGTYTFIGKRKGYITVREVIKLTESSSLLLICSEKL